MPMHSSWHLPFYSSKQTKMCVRTTLVWCIYAGRNAVCLECVAHRDTRPFTYVRADAALHPGEAMPLIAYPARMREPHHPLTDNALFCRRYCFPI